MNQGAIDFVEADAKGKFHKEIFAPSDKEVAELEEQIKEVAKNILDGKFTGCGEKDCQYCGL
jgi:PHP family Zn ribbon phosphoesterase